MTYLTQNEIANNRAMLNRVAQAAASEVVGSTRIGGRTTTGATGRLHPPGMPPGSRRGSPIPTTRTTTQAPTRRSSLTA